MPLLSATETLGREADDLSISLLNRAFGYPGFGIEICVFSVCQVAASVVVRQAIFCQPPDDDSAIQRRQLSQNRFDLTEIR